MSRIEYDRGDEITSVISPSGRSVHYSYDSRGQIDGKTDGLGGQVRFRYDNRGNLVALTDQRGNTTTYSYDELYRPSGRRDPLGRGSSIAYDANDNVTETVDRLGRRVIFSYDVLDRLTHAGYVDALVDYVYDAASRMVRIDDTQGGTTAWVYDNANRLASETTPSGVVNHLYNSAGQRVSMTASDRPPVNFAYDPAGRLQTITQGAETFGYGYDLLSRRTFLQRPNGVTTSYSYDDVNRLVRQKHAKSGSAPIEDLRFTYNIDDEIASIESLASAQLLPASKTASAADAANRIADFGTASFSFDLEGQTISKTNAQGVTSNQWDARGRLTRATLPGGEVVTYGYDALGRRANRSAGGVTTSFLYDADDVVLDRNSDLSTVDYINGPGIDEKLSLSRSSGPNTGALYFVDDHLGSTSALTDSTGTVVERFQYEPFGESASSAFTRFGFTGRERDTATGLMYYRARWYDPEQKSFLTDDPLRSGAGLNLRTYVGNNPLRFRDPLGLAKVYYWGPEVSSRRVGHLSIRLEDGTYISFWPKEGGAGIVIGKQYPGTTHKNYDEDVTAEGRGADEAYQVDGLDEAAIKEWWDKQNQALPNYSAGYVCSNAVADALKKGGLNPMNSVQPCGQTGICMPREIVNGMIEENTRLNGPWYRRTDVWPARSKKGVTVKKVNP